MKNMKRILSVKIRRMEDLDPDISWLEGERFEAFKMEQFEFIGIRADAEVLVPVNMSLSAKERAATCSYITQTITSGGLWGIESDSDALHLAETVKEQLAELREQLEALGFSKRAISVAFKSAANVEG